jgi:hypothetical protein
MLTVSGLASRQCEQAWSLIAGGSPKPVKLTSPRSLLACLQTGIDPKEVIYR